MIVSRIVTIANMTMKDKKSIILVMILSVIFILGFSIPDVLGYTFVGVTSNGVEFPIVQINPEYSDSTNSTDSVGDGDSILDGIGVYLTIQNIGTNGMVYFGEDGTNNSAQTDIRQYVGVGNNDDWVIVIVDDDIHETLSVSEFGTEYTYYSGYLINVTESAPNILGYSIERSLDGSVNAVINNDGITFTGTGEKIFKLNNYDGESLFLRGFVDDGDEIKIITSDVDLIGDTIYSDGYMIYSANIDPSSNSFSVEAGIDSTHTGIQYFDGYMSIDTRAISKGQAFACHGDRSTQYGTTNLEIKVSDSLCLYGVIPVTIKTTLEKTNQIVHYTITGDNTIIELLNYDDNDYYDQYNENYIFELYDTLPSTQIAEFSEGDFEGMVEFPSEQTYLYVKLEGGNANIKGEAFDPQLDVYLEIDGLPADTAYDITKSGITGIVGKTSSTGEISLLYNDVDFGIVSSPGGILTIYPDSVKYLGSLNNVAMIDLYNGYSIPLYTTTDLAYIPQNYVYWVFPTEVEFENVMVDDIALSYLNKNYTKNEAVLIPVIPSANTIYATINGVDVEVLMRDVSTTTQITHVAEKSSTTSDHATSGTVSVSSNISTSTFLTATHTGTMSIDFDFKVGGSADFSMGSEYTGQLIEYVSCDLWYTGHTNDHDDHVIGDQYSQCTTGNIPTSDFSYSIPASDIFEMSDLFDQQQKQLTAAINSGQLSNLIVEVDIYNNMQYVNTIMIYTNDSAKHQLQPR